MLTSSSIYNFIHILTCFNHSLHYIITVQPVVSTDYITVHSHVAEHEMLVVNE